MSVVEVPFRLEGNSIVIAAKVNGAETEMILDTGDAVGPVVGPADAHRCHVLPEAPMQVSGAGGAAQAYTAHMRVNLGGVIFYHEPGAIDLNLAGFSLLGLPFFLSKADVLAFDFARGILAFELKAAPEPTEVGDPQERSVNVERWPWGTSRAEAIGAAEAA